MQRFILVRQSPKRKDRFPDVIICDTSETVPAVVNGRETRVYKPVSEVMPYLDALRKRRELTANISGGD